MLSPQMQQMVLYFFRGAGTEADAYVNENEAPEFAVDGDVSTKWCATGAAPHEITLDLGEVNTVSAVDIFHAEAGGESADMNTKSYTILVSQDGNSFEEVYSVTKIQMARRTMHLHQKTHGM